MPDKLIIAYTWPEEPTYAAGAATIETPDKSFVALVTIRRSNTRWQVAFHAAGQEPIISATTYATFARALEVAHERAFGWANASMK